MKCAYSGCYCEIPSTRRGNAKYCSSNCYRFAKKNRDRNDYFLKAKKLDRYNQNIKILEFFAKKNEPVHKRELFIAGYDFLSFDKLSNDPSNLTFSIGRYLLVARKITSDLSNGKVTLSSFRIIKR